MGEAETERENATSVLGKIRCYKGRFFKLLMYLLRYSIPLLSPSGNNIRKIIPRFFLNLNKVGTL